MKRILSFLLSVCILLTALPALAEERAEHTAINKTAAFLTQTVSAPSVGSIGGEWAVFGLARSGALVPDGYFNGYYERLLQYVTSRGGVLHTQKYTEYSRVIFALTAIGKDPRNVGGYNLLEPLADFQKTVYQGINGAAFALLALDSDNYAIPHRTDGTPSATREDYLTYLLSAELPDGGWALSGDVSEPDITAMILTAFAPYQERADVKAATDRALNCLSQMQSETGGFPSYGAESAESSAQVLVALCSLSISPSDPRFTKTGNCVFDHLLSFQTEDGGFCHQRSDTSPNLMATEQSLYALAALERFQSGKPILYDMTDVSADAMQLPSFGLSQKHPDVSQMPVISPGKPFRDTADHPNKSAIEALGARGIINGKSDAVFDPDSTMTRAEFAAIVVRALGLPQVGNSPFADVRESDWFYSYVNTAYAYGIVKGVSESAFSPHSTITREEAAVMVARAARMAGLDTAVASPVDTLCAFTDYPSVADWAAESLAFAYSSGILSDEEMEIMPKVPVCRAEIAQMLYNALSLSHLL